MTQSKPKHYRVTRIWYVQATNPNEATKRASLGTHDDIHVEVMDEAQVIRERGRLT